MGLLRSQINARFSIRGRMNHREGIGESWHSLISLAGPETRQLLIAGLVDLKGGSVKRCGWVPGVT